MNSAAGAGSAAEEADGGAAHSYNLQPVVSYAASC